MEEFISYVIVYPNPSSPWSCAPLIVPERGPAEWPFTVDLCPVKKFPVPYQFPMPVIEHELAKTSSSIVFSGVDFTQSYWQLLLRRSSRVCQPFITSDGAFTPTRVLRGTTNGVLHLQPFPSTNLSASLRHRVLL